MNKYLRSFYFNSPYFVKCLMATIEGYRLINWRYSKKTEELINNYYERETWSDNDWQKWIHNQLGESLNNA